MQRGRVGGERGGRGAWREYRFLLTPAAKKWTPPPRSAPLNCQHRKPGRPSSIRAVEGSMMVACAVSPFTPCLWQVPASSLAGVAMVRAGPRDGAKSEGDRTGMGFASYLRLNDLR